MAYYKDSKYLKYDPDPAFDKTHPPGANTPFSGIYRCAGCGHEITSVAPHPLPPQSHHQHNALQGHIRWQLIVGTTHAR